MTSYGENMKSLSAGVFSPPFTIKDLFIYLLQVWPSPFRLGNVLIWKYLDTIGEHTRGSERLIFSEWNESPGNEVERSKVCWTTAKANFRVFFHVDLVPGTSMQSGGLRLAKVRGPCKGQEHLQGTAPSGSEQKPTTDTATYFLFSFSTHSGASWSATVRVQEENPLRRAGMALEDLHYPAHCSSSHWEDS